MITPLKHWLAIGVAYRQGDPTFYNDWHLGTDKLASYDDFIFAPADGNIILSNTFQDGGNTIWYEYELPFYGKVVQRFLHLSRKYPVGAYREKDILGRVGNTGLVSPTPTASNPKAGTHLHTDISKKKVDLADKSNFIDPELVFDYLDTKQQKVLLIRNKINDSERAQLFEALRDANDFFYEATNGEVTLRFDIVDREDLYQGKNIGVALGNAYEVANGTMVNNHQVAYNAHQVTDLSDYDIVMLVYNPDDVVPRPTHSMHIPTFDQVFTIVELMMFHTYDKYTLRETLIHEILHAWYFLINKRSSANLKDDVHNYSGTEDPRPETNYKRLVEKLSQFYKYLIFNNIFMRYVIVNGKEQYLLEDNLKIALNIGDPEQLEILRAQGLQGDPEPVDNVDGYLQYPLVTKDKLKDIFGL